MVQQRKRASRIVLDGPGVDGAPAIGWSGMRATTLLPHVPARGSITPRYRVTDGAALGGTCLPKDVLGSPGDVAEIGVDVSLMRAVFGSSYRLEVVADERAGAVAGRAISHSVVAS